MSEARLLSLVARYPQRAALARRVRDGSVFEMLRRLEARGYVWRQHDHYRLTRAGRNELAMTLALLRLVRRRA
jgi:Mn-dependent DtxR family transcriptional regulator